MTRETRHMWVRGHKCVCCFVVNALNVHARVLMQVWFRQQRSRVGGARHKRCVCEPVHGARERRAAQHVHVQRLSHVSEPRQQLPRVQHHRRRRLPHLPRRGVPAPGRVPPGVPPWVHRARAGLLQSPLRTHHDRRTHACTHWHTVHVPHPAHAHTHGRAHHVHAIDGTVGHAF